VTTRDRVSGKTPASHRKNNGHAPFPRKSAAGLFCYPTFVPFPRPKRTYDTEASLYDYAVRALSRKMRTVAELKRLMRPRVPEGELGDLLVEIVIRRLKDQKYLNDSNYAAAYSAFRRDNEKFGRRRVITDLKVKGVHADVIEKAVADAYSGADEEALARGFLKRKRLKKPEDNKDAARIFRALLRAGFEAGIAIKVLKKWEVDDEVLAALGEEAEE
jgi:regulatory protein